MGSFLSVFLTGIFLVGFTLCSLQTPAYADPIGLHPPLRIHMVLKAKTASLHRLLLWTQTSNAPFSALSTPSAFSTSQAQREFDCDAQQYRALFPDGEKSAWVSLSKTSKTSTINKNFVSYLCHQRYGTWQSAYSTTQLKKNHRPVWVRGKHRWHLAKSL